MTQNDRLLSEQSIPILSKKDKANLRAKWQQLTIADMNLSLALYNMYLMLRPTGFGKTYVCAKIAGDYVKKGKVIFVYKSDILKITFEEYTRGENRLIENPQNIIYETYTSVGLRWNDKDYLENELNIKDVSLIIFDECQYMGAETYRKALDFALTYIGHDVYTDNDKLIKSPMRSRYNIPYIGATATIERRDVDVCDKYFTYNNNGKLTYCWGEHIITLEDAFKTGLIIPPYYKYIGSTDKNGNSLVTKNRLTRQRLLKNLKTFNKDGDPFIAKSMEELQNCRIYNADKIIHDTMLHLYNCKNPLIQDEDLPVSDAVFDRPQNLPKYMRFLVFGHDRDTLSQARTDGKSDFLGIVEETKNHFESAFGRYGYVVRTTIISSICAEETKNVHLIDPPQEVLDKLNAKIVSEDDISKAVTDKNNGKSVIDLIFSINMLNVGYHVDKITGLVFRRWTGSNTIYYQQLGRCLSSNSDTIPVVFDFVDSLATAEITSPLFAIDKEKKAITRYADGTQDTSYKGPKKHKKRINSTVLKDGQPFNPKWVNAISSSSILVDTLSADHSEILGRLNVHDIQIKARTVFEEAYEKYLEGYRSEGGIITHKDNMLPLYECLRWAIYRKYNEKISKAGLLTINYAAFYNYIKRKEYDVFIEYSLFKKYCASKEAKEVVNQLACEYNSLLMTANNDTNVYNAKLNFVVNEENEEEFSKDKNVQNAINKYNVKSGSILLYTA